MEPLAILSLILFAALTVAFLAFLRRASALVAGIREHERLQAEVRALDERVDAVLEPLAARIEDVRHHRASAGPLDEQVAGCRELLEQAIVEAAALRTVPALADAPSMLVEAYTKVDRALRLVEHGVAGLSTTRGGPRELEAQTSLKRGALALRNARAEAVAIAHRVAGTPPPGQPRRAGAADSARSGVGAGAVVPPPPATLVARHDDTSDPSM